MIDLQWALVFALTRLQVFLFCVPQLPSLAMAGVTEVCGAKAEEEGDRAAVATLVVNELIAMLLTQGLPVVAVFHNRSCTFGADQLIRLDLPWLLFLVFCSRATLLVTAKVRLFAVIALIVVQVVESELGHLVEVLRLGVLDSFIGVQPFVLGPLLALVQDASLHFFRLFDDLLHPVVLRRINKHIALRTLGVLEVNGGPVPLLLQLVLDAVHVEDVLARELDHGLLSEAGNVADGAETV